MDWEIQPLSKQCAGCGGPFRDDDEFHCFLVLSGEGIPERSDFCRNCFSKPKSSWTARPDLYSCWQGRAKLAPPPPRPRPLPYERFEMLLRKYIDAKESRDPRFIYILALLLERKKILIHRESVLKEDSLKRFLVYEHAQTGESFCLEDPVLSLSQVEEVQSELKEMMDAELQVGS